MTHSLAINEGDVNPGLLGFVIVALLGVATFLLIRSMHRQLKKIDFDEQDPAPGPDDRPDPRG
ncbi:MAG: hypothetical protein QOE01_1444 [Actinomycetota bacterium]|nr:hypothetical protein [Actinomycetota bacterium]